MASMSLKFILCEPEEASAIRTHKQQNKRLKRSNAMLETSLELSSPNNSSSFGRHHPKEGKKSSKTVPKVDRQQHARQLQNLRQRRYRERKKSSVSALQLNSKQLHQENGVLEATILDHFKLQTYT